MSRKTLVIILVLALQVGLVVFLANTGRRSGDGMLSRLFETRLKGGPTGEEKGRPFPTAGTLAERYVERPRARVAPLLADPGFRDLPPETRRVKLIEYFTLKVIDTDFTLLPEAEQRRIMDAFLKACQAEPRAADRPISRPD